MNKARGQDREKMGRTEYEDAVRCRFVALSARVLMWLKQGKYLYARRISNLHTEAQ